MSKGWIIALSTALHWACVGELEPVPSCFQDGQEQLLTGASLTLNLCCTPGGAGDLSCQGALMTLDSPVAELAYCRPTGVCAVCELGVSCECITHQDCQAQGQRCQVSDDTARCLARLDAPPTLARCALCSP